MDPAHLLRDARRRHHVDQRSLARRAGTSQTHISRIERGEVSPSTETLARLLQSLGEQLELRAAPIDHGNQSVAELRHDYERLSAGERVEQAAELSYVVTSLASGRPSK